ncbi:MAG TPA: amino acid permease [Propionibacteriaceae bacterium]|jgi:amino acid transporter|nr:amino acid permease [Propionibacteriaceae bacterium]
MAEHQEDGQPQTGVTAGPEFRDRDERKLAELGYKQELERAWSGFSNFAISFTIISILAGCFTTYGQAWNNGGPIAISIGWPLICIIVLIVAFCMAELASAFPTAGGPYWWAARLGGPGWSWFTGWFNIIGLIGVVASVDYAAAAFASTLFNLWGLNLGVLNFADGASLGDVFWVFAVLLAVHALLNIYSSHLVALFNNISVWWHVVGVLVIIAILAFIPDHQSASFVFTKTLNNSGFGHGLFWWYVLPLGFLLTMYTQTGYDASAHVAEETHDAEIKVARGLWQSVFWAAVFGWLVLLAITFAAKDVDAINEGGGTSLAVFTSAMSSRWAESVILISTVGQIFCGMACLTSASRTWYAFSRDRAIPGWRTWVRLSRHRVPALSVFAVAALSLVVTLPALWGTAAGIPWAFYAVVSITVIGLYIAYVAPVYLRLRAGDTFKPGAWNLGGKYRWMCTVAVVWTVIAMVIFSLPFTPAAVPWSGEFDWTAVNYAPLTVLAVIVAVGIWWLAGANKTYTGPVRTIEFDEGLGIIEEAPAAPPAAEPESGPAT